MNATVLTVPGTITADGTLQLDAKLNLPPGRVTVTVQPAAVSPSNDAFLQTMERIWAEQRARGQVPRSTEEVEAELQAMQDDAEAEMRELERLHQPALAFPGTVADNRR